MIILSDTPAYKEAMTGKIQAFHLEGCTFGIYVPEKLLNGLFKYQVDESDENGIVFCQILSYEELEKAFG